jgi:aryl-alcohol dehydrogenase-like predicted oxidoreductase
MKKRRLGNASLVVSALGMGAMNLSANTGPAKDKNYADSVIRYGVEIGITLLNPSAYHI